MGDRCKNDDCDLSDRFHDPPCARWEDEIVPDDMPPQTDTDAYEEFWEDRMKRWESGESIQRWLLGLDAPPFRKFKKS